MVKEYVFKVVPVTNPTQATNVDRQIRKIFEEAAEVYEAMEDVERDEEVMDTITACVTYFSLRGYSQDMLTALAEQVYEKNNRRGYYNEE